MISYISPLDPNYISFRRAACLISDEHRGVSPDELMDNFKHALFKGDFECANIDPRKVFPNDVNPHHDRHNALNWLHMDYQMPPDELAISGKALKIQPHRLYGMNLDSIASILICEEALPGSASDWETFFNPPKRGHKAEVIYPRLAHIPFASYPAHGQTLIDNILISRIKLKLWMIKHNFSLPNFLQNIDINLSKKSMIKLVPSPDEEPQKPDAIITPTEDFENPAESKGAPQNLKVKPVQDKTPSNDNHPASKGRPRKAGWDKVEDLVRNLHRADSRKLKKLLAYEAYTQALSEFPENELPTVETIIRNMAKILNNKQK